MGWTACFDLEHQICSADFYGWLIEFAHRGATEIVFCARKWREGASFSDEVMHRRFETIIKPGPAFLGLPSREGEDGERVGLGYKTPHLIKFAQHNKTFKRLRSILPPGSARYTVTIRQSTEDRWRNSNKAAWLQFADDIGAVVIDDYQIRPYDYRGLLSLYAGAEMNFGVVNGPMHVCSLSDYPCMVMNCGAHGRFFTRCGMSYGDNMPWCKRNQRFFWDTDTLDNIRQRYREWALVTTD